MRELIIFVLPIIIGIIVCLITQNRGWLKSFIFSLIFVFIILIMSSSGNTNGEIIAGFLGTAIGSGLIFGTIGYSIGRAIFKRKGHEKTNGDKKNIK